MIDSIRPVSPAKCSPSPLRTVIVLGVLGLSMTLATSPASSQEPWVDFADETSGRLVGAPGVTVDDPEEKNFAFGDLDLDGDLDLVVARKAPWTTFGPRANVLFRNDGGVLTDVTASLAIASLVPGDEGFLTPTNDRDIIIVDVTGDGWPDVVTAPSLADGTAKELSHPRVYVNQGAPGGNWLGLQYEPDRIPQLEGLAPSGFPHAPRFVEVAAGDVDGDGDVDLYFTDHDSGGAQTYDFDDRLLLNDGTGVFTDVTATAFTGVLGVGSWNFPTSGFGTSAVIVDLNNDGWMDILKSTSLNPPQYVAVALNDPMNPGSFSELELIEEAATYHVDVADLNNDGLFDIITASDGVDRFALNSGGSPPTFAFETFSFVGGDPGFAGDVATADLDLDGFLDVLITGVQVDIPGCNRRLHLFHNQGNAPSVDLVEEGYSVASIPDWLPTGVHDVALFDIDGDGWTDLVQGTCNGVEVWINEPIHLIEFEYPNGRPQVTPCDTGSSFLVQLETNGTGAVPDPASLELWYTVDGGPPQSGGVIALGGDSYEVTIPATPGPAVILYGFSATFDGGVPAADPADYPISSYTLAVANEVTVSDWDFEGGVGGWSVEVGSGLVSGAWERAIPNGTTIGSQQVAPYEDASPLGSFAFVTENGELGGTAGAADVDGGENWLVSPALSIAGAPTQLSFAAWFSTTETVPFEMDRLDVEFSADGGPWISVMTIGQTEGWETFTLSPSALAPGANQIEIRFGVSDLPNNSLTEAGIDDVVLEVYSCSTPLPFVRGDVNGDTNVDIADPIAALAQLFAGASSSLCPDRVDANDDGTVDVADPIYTLAHLFTGASAPPAPFPDCGADPTDTDPLGCPVASGCP